MGLSPQLITSSLYKRASSDLYSLRQESRAALRLRAIVSAKTEGVSVVSKVFGITTNTLRAWVKSYSQDGVSGLEYKCGRGRKSHLNEEHRQQIKSWIQEDFNITISQILLKLKKKYGSMSSKSAVHRVLHEMGLSYITPRPVHHKQDQSTHSEFKKKSHQ